MGLIGTTILCGAVKDAAGIATIGFFSLERGTRIFRKVQLACGRGDTNEIRA